MSVSLPSLELQEPLCLCASLDSCLLEIYPHQLRSQYGHCKCSLEQKVLQFRPQTKAAYDAKGSSLWAIKSLSKNTFDFSDPIQAYLSLAGFLNMLSLRTSLRVFSINFFAELLLAIMRFLFLPLP